MKSQIVVPVHNRERPVARAVASVLEDPGAGVIVVAHNIDPRELTLPKDSRVKVVKLDGHVGYPGAAFDCGIAAATAEWVGIMGSDDWFEPGALQALREHGEADNADGVLAPLSYQGGSKGFSPRTLRHRNLQAARDRLFYRTAPLGLYRREVLQHPEYAFGHTYPVGSDMQVSVRLWTSGRRFSYYPDSPAYVVGSDAKERTTLTRRPLSEHGKAWLEIWDQRWVEQLDTETRHALAVKILRVHVLGAVQQRSEASDWLDGDFEWLGALTRRILMEDPGAALPFRQASARTLRLLTQGDLESVLASSASENHAAFADKMLTSNAAAVLEPDAPLRWNTVALGNWLRGKLTGFTGHKSPSSMEVRGNPNSARPSVLIFSFSPIIDDARVLKQVHLLRDRYEVTTCGFGGRPEGVQEHIELPAELLPSALDGRLITMHAYVAAYWSIPAITNAWKMLKGRRFDIVLANDIEAVPLALRMKPTRGVHADLHEHYPSMHEYDEAWKRRISPYYSWLCRRYATRANSVTTVSRGLQRAYEQQFGIRPELVVNATPYAEINPTPVETPIRLVHSGAGQRKRRLEVMLDAVRDTTANVTLDLYLTLNDPEYLEQLRRRYADEASITFHDPVPYTALVNTLNAYDVGVFVLPPQTFSYEWALPNKFFDYLQARLGILVGPSPEMVTYVRELGNGAVASNFEATALRSELEALVPAKVVEWKRASARAAQDLAAENQSQAWADAISALAAAGNT